MRVLVLIVILSCLTCEQTALAGETRAVKLRWPDVAQMIPGKQIEVTTTSGSKVKGRVRLVDADAIVLEKGKSPRIDRSGIVQIRMTQYIGNGRYFGKFLGGIAGLIIGLAGAAVIGLREGSGRRTSDKVLVGAVGIGGFPAGLLGGYYLGRLADKEVTVIHIIPEPATATQ